MNQKLSVTLFPGEPDVLHGYQACKWSDTHAGKTYLYRQNTIEKIYLTFPIASSTPNKSAVFHLKKLLLLSRRLYGEVIDSKMN